MQLSFNLDLRDPARRRVRVEILAPVTALRPATTPGAPIELFLPAWTPGSYLLREYARHLGDLQAIDTATGATLPSEKTAKNRFRITPMDDGGEVRISYTLYAHELTVRTCDLTDRHAFLSGAAVFLWPLDLTREACEVTVRLQVPRTWDVQTSLSGGRIADGEFELRAHGLDELVDSPILAGEFQTLSFEVLDKPHRLVLDGLAGIAPPESLVPDATAIIEQAAAIFGGSLPYDEYKFLCMFSDSGRGGLEHRAGSVLLAPRTTFRRDKDYRDFLGLIAHEFFHVWNVKRMRPAEFWEFDYENENYTELLWVAEGFTAYFDDHLCRRAGVMSAQRYLDIVANGITELRRTPGRHHQTLAEASFDAWIRLYRPDENSRNSTLSYYGNGALAALCIDLRIRQETGGEHSLDDVVRALYEGTFGAGRGYTHDDVVRFASEAAGCDLAEFVDSLVRQPLDPDFAAVLAPFGLSLEEKSSASSCFLGVHFKSGSTTLSSVLEDTPADLAGLMPQDEILALNDLRVTARSWTDVFDHVAAVDRPLEVLVARRGRVSTIETVPTSRPVPGIEIAVVADSTAEQSALRRGWLFDEEI